MPELSTIQSRGLAGVAHHDVALGDLEHLGRNLTRSGMRPFGRICGECDIFAASATT
jgi:hypothetical protein